MYPGLLATAQDCFPISNGQSPQLSPELSFAPGPGRAGSCSDWPPQQTNAANNDSLIFSSSSQRYNPGQNHYPHSAARTRMTIYDTPQQSFERGDGECRHGSLYSEDQLSTQLFGNRFPNISATQPYGSPGQPQAYTFSQPDSRTRSGHSSNGSTPTATRAGVTDMVPDIFNSANDTHTSLYSGGSSGFHFSNDIQPPLNLETSNSYYSPDTDTVSSFELTENECLVSNSRSLSSPRLTDSHNDTLENNIQHLSLHRSSSTGPYNRRSPIAQAHLQPKPEKSVAEGTERNSLVKNEYHLPRKNRGRRTRPLEERKRMNATRRRNERTVCIGCKLAKVMVSLLWETCPLIVHLPLIPPFFFPLAFSLLCFVTSSFGPTHHTYSYSLSYPHSIVCNTMTNMLLSSARVENTEETVSVAPVGITMLRSHLFVFLRASSNSFSKIALYCLVSDDYNLEYWAVY